MSKIYRTICCLAAICLSAGALWPEDTESSKGGPGPASWSGSLEPIDASEWSYERAAHLLERAGFGGTPEEIARLAAMTPAQAVDSLVNYEKIDISQLPPFVPSDIWDPGMDPFPDSRNEATRQAEEKGESMGVKILPEGPRRYQPVVDKFFFGLNANRLEGRRLSNWWANRMVASPRPLEEKMALFWHGHFATSNEKVRDARKLERQLAMLHANATGNYRGLVLGITKDPAMLVFLDNGLNVKGRPNENFGRELMELFTMGVGNYTETDIREAARAFTGWTHKDLGFVFDESKHDAGEKNVLGKKGALNGEDVIDAILSREQTAEYISAKLYRYLVNDSPTPEMVKALGAKLRESKYEFKPWLTTVFLSKDFYSPKSFGTMIKSPVVLAVSTYRKLGQHSAPGVPDFNESTAVIGQELLAPPNVAGWEQGRAWITPSTLIERGNFAREILFPDLGSFRPPDRRMPGIYAEVGRKLAAGMDIAEATTEGDSSFAKLANANEEFNTRYGSYKGWSEAFRRVIPIPRDSAQFSLVKMVQADGAKTPEDAVGALARRFLSVPLRPANQTELSVFLQKQLRSDNLNYADYPAFIEDALRETLHSIMSLPEYQLN